MIKLMGLWMTNLDSLLNTMTSGVSPDTLQQTEKPRGRTYEYKELDTEMSDILSAIRFRLVEAWVEPERADKFISKFWNDIREICKWENIEKRLRIFLARRMSDIGVLGIRLDILLKVIFNQVLNCGNTSNNLNCGSTSNK